MGIDIELYSVAEVARKLQVSDETIYRWLKSGNLKAVKIGGQWRIKESELRRLLGELDEEGSITNSNSLMGPAVVIGEELEDG